MKNLVQMYNSNRIDSFLSIGINYPQIAPNLSSHNLIEIGSLKAYHFIHKRNKEAFKLISKELKKLSEKRALSVEDYLKNKTSKVVKPKPN